MITALGEMWHPEHFLCVVCQSELSSTGFCERDGRPYCDKDYHRLFSPRCAYCKGPILHVRKASFCYFSFLLSPIWEIKQGEVTVLCNLSIFQNILTALDQTWHPEHFFCTHCGGLFGSEGLGGLHINFSSLKISTCKQLEII